MSNSGRISEEKMNALFALLEHVKGAIGDEEYAEIMTALTLPIQRQQKEYKESGDK